MHFIIISNVESGFFNVLRKCFNVLRIYRFGIICPLVSFSLANLKDFEMSRCVLGMTPSTWIYRVLLSALLTSTSFKSFLFIFLTDLSLMVLLSLVFTSPVNLRFIIFPSPSPCLSTPASAFYPGV